MPILVIGGSGFTGRNLVRRLVSRGESVVSTSRSVPARDEIPAVRRHQVDLRTFDRWPALLDGVSTVYHLAWSTVPATAASAPISDVEDNVVGSLRLLEALRSRPETRLVFASSGGTVYGGLTRIPVREDDPAAPISAHGAAKLAVERYIAEFAQLHGIPAVTLRIGNTYGPGQLSSPMFGAVAAFCRHAVAGEPISIYGDGSIVRDYVYIDDVVDALLAAGAATGRHRTFNIGSGRGTSLNELVRMIEGVLGRPVEVRHLPGRTYDIPVSVLDIGRARAGLGWQPRMAIEDGIARVLQSYAEGGSRA